MKPENRKYILQHQNKKSAKQIADHLKIKERTVQRFIDQQDQKTQQQTEKVETQEKQKYRLNWWLLLLVVAVGFAAYANALQGEFIWDDNILVRNNKDIRDWGNLDKVIFGNLGGETLYYKHSSYRPVQTITYMIDYSLWKMNPFGYHLTNIICHLTVAACLFILMFKIFRSNYISFVASFLFVLHPVHTEAITYISGRADPLSVAFMLLSLIFYFRVLEKEAYVNYLLMAVFYILGILSRENALMVPVFVFVYHIAMRKKINWKPLSVYGLLAGIYIFLRVNEIVGGLGLKEPIKTSLTERIPGFFVAYTTYMAKLIAPFHLHMEYLRPMFEMSNPKAIIGAFLFMGSVGAAVFMRKRVAAVTFGLLWFLVGLFPVSNVFVVVNAYMAEHWLYVPSMGLFLMIAYGAERLSLKSKQLKIAMVWVVFGIGLFWGVRTHQQNKTWHNQIAFYERLKEYAPTSGRLFADMGEAYYRVGRVDDALNSTIRAIQLRPTYYAAYSNLGTIYVRKGEPENAIEAYKKSLAIRPSYFNAHFNLANVYKDQNKFEDAITHYNLALKHMPSLTQAYNNLAICYSRTGEKDKAVTFYKKALMFEPNNTKFINNLASVLSDIGQHKEAVDLYKRALTLSPSKYDQAIIYYNLALGYYRLDDRKNAAEAFKMGNQLPVSSPLIYQQLAVIYNKTGLNSQAKFLLRRAKMMNPRKKK